MARMNEPTDDSLAGEGLTPAGDGAGDGPGSSASISGGRVITFGCRLNTYESEVIRSHLQSRTPEQTVVINTCAVTSEAERQARQTIRRVRRETPDALIVVTGCAAQIDPERYSAMAEVDHVVGNHEKLLANTWSTIGDPFAPAERAIVNDIQSVRETASHLVDGFTERTRGFVQVQQGCDHRCTFCIIPYGRGPSRSVPVAEVVRQVQALVDNGTAEVVLCGVDVTSFGGDLPGRPSLGYLVSSILRHVPDLPRLRLSSLDCMEVDDTLWRLIGEEPRLMPHLHLSLQSGDAMILKRMKRRHSPQEAIDLTRRARALRPDMVFGADLIAGFPTETEEMARNTRAIIETCDLTWVHVFPYSERAGTPAARMPQVPGTIRKERAALLRDVARAAEARFLESRIGKTESILIENSGLGRTEHFAPVRLEDGAMPAGSLITARVTGWNEGILTARRDLAGSRPPGRVATDVSFPS